MSFDATDHWRGVYRARRPEETSWHQPEPQPSLDWIRSACPHGSARVIDIGAGASNLVDHLLGAGYTELTAIDLSAEALAESRARLGELASQVEWIATDLCEFEPPHSYDLWHDRAVLHFLVDPSDRRRYADVLRRSLAPRGHALIATFAVGGPTRCSGLDTEQYDSARLAALLGPGFTLVRDSEVVHRTPSGAEQRFHYALFQRGDAGQPAAETSPAGVS